METEFIAYIKYIFIYTQIYKTKHKILNSYTMNKDNLPPKDFTIMGNSIY